MPYAECCNCTKIMTRSGGRGFRLVDFCCPFCGSEIKSAKTPNELQTLAWQFDSVSVDMMRQLTAHAPQAVMKWLYEARKIEPDWLRAMQGTTIFTRAK